MFSYLNLLFTSGTVEADRDALVLGTLCQLVEQNRETWNGYTTPDVTDYCLGVSLDRLYAALPVTMDSPSAPLRPALTIAQTVQSLNRLQDQYVYIRNEDGFEVLHLHRNLIFNQNHALDREIMRREDASRNARLEQIMADQQTAELI